MTIAAGLRGAEVVVGSLPMKCSAAGTAFLLSLVLPVAAHAQAPNGNQQDMQAGGLSPPPPESEESDSAKTEENLEKAEKEDSGRGLEFFYLNAEIGAEHLGLQTFHSNNIVDANVVATTQTGLLFGAGLGLRLLFITVGPRFRLAHFSQYDMWTLGAEVGLRIPLGNLEPYFVLGGGYASLGAFNATNFGPNTNDVAIRGYNIRGGGGLDYYVTPVFSVGANVTAELVGLTRPGVANPATGMTMVGMGGVSNVYSFDGSSLGMGIAGTVVLGLHF